MARRKTPGATPEVSPELEKLRADRRKVILQRAEKRAAAEAARKAAAGAQPKSKTQAIEEYGLERLLDDIADCRALEDIAAQLGCSRRWLSLWIAEDPIRVKAVDQARMEAAHRWANKAQEVLESIPSDATRADQTRARELASHYRWMAAMTNRGVYGDKQEVTVKQGVEEMTDEQLDAELSQRLATHGIDPAVLGAAARRMQ